MSSIDSSIRTAVATTDRRALIQQLVHKLDENEVLLTDWCPEDDATVRIAADWPRSIHPFYDRGPGGAPDPLLVMETVRQAGLLTCHAQHAIPLDHRFGWERLEFELSPGSAVLDERRIQVEVRSCDLVRRGNRITRLTLDYQVSQDGRPLARAGCVVSLLDERVYRRLRGAAGIDPMTAFARALPPAPPIPARQVGRHRAEDVMLGLATTRRHVSPDAQAVWSLRIDTRHPVLFDHPVDHAPGTALIEAARQAARALFHPVPTRVSALSCAFKRYIELDRPCLVEALRLPAEPGEPARVRVRFRQDDGEPACTADFTVSPAAPGPRTVKHTRVGATRSHVRRLHTDPTSHSTGGDPCQRTHPASTA